MTLIAGNLESQSKILKQWREQVQVYRPLTDWRWEFWPECPNYIFLFSAQVTNQKLVVDKKETLAQKGEKGDKGAPGEPGLRGQPGSDVSNYRHFVTHYSFLYWQPLL